MLIRALKIHIRGPSKIVAVIQHTAVADAGIEPHIENVAHLLVFILIDTEALIDIFPVPAVDTL